MVLVKKNLKILKSLLYDYSCHLALINFLFKIKVQPQDFEQMKQYKNAISQNLALGNYKEVSLLIK